jgi:hypothetical protein
MARRSSTRTRATREAFSLIAISRGWPGIEILGKSSDRGVEEKRAVCISATLAGR